MLCRLVLKYHLSSSVSVDGACDVNTTIISVRENVPPGKSFVLVMTFDSMNSAWLQSLALNLVTIGIFV